MSQTSFKESNVFKLLAVFLMIFLIFNTRLIMEVPQEIFDGDNYIKSLSISQPRIRSGGGSQLETVNFFRDYKSELSVTGANWLKEYGLAGKLTVVDYSSLELFYAMFPPQYVYEAYHFGIYLSGVKRCDYIFLRELNVKYGIMSGGYTQNDWNTSQITPFLEAEFNKIYSDGGAIIYASTYLH
jgi:uncharacterized membrane protein